MANLIKRSLPVPGDPFVTGVTSLPIEEIRLKANHLEWFDRQADEHPPAALIFYRLALPLARQLAAHYAHQVASMEAAFKGRRHD